MDGRLLCSPGPAAANALSPKRRCCMSTSQRMFGSLWDVVIAHEHQRQYGSRRLAAMVKCQTTSERWTSVATLKSTHWCTDSQCSWPSTSIMWSEYRVPVTRRVAVFWTDCNRFISLQRYGITESCSSPGDRRRSLQTIPDSLPQLVVATLTDHCV